MEGVGYALRSILDIVEELASVSDQCE